MTVRVLRDYLNTIHRRVRGNRRIRATLVPLVRAARSVEPALLCVIRSAASLNSEASILDIEELKRARLKDTVFIMGCGYSINDISQAEWKHIADTGDVFSFNHFYMGEFVPIVYHACGEVGHPPGYASVLLSRKNRHQLSSYYQRTFGNPLYDRAVFFLRYRINVMRLPVATSIWALHFSRAFKGKRVCLYGINPCFSDSVTPPSESISSISHHAATLSDVVNISYLLGYTRIVLVGVDLYDRRYFWLPQNQTRELDAKRGRSYADVHQTTDLIVKVMDAWNQHLREKGVRLYVYNPRSLLRAVLPVYNIDALNASNGET